jgi:large subunit ribosomal protein L21e
MPSKKAKGKRAKTRSKFTRKHSKTTVNQHFVEWKTGSKVQISIDSSIHSGLPFRRFIGRTATILGKKGKVYNLEIFDGKLRKQLLIHPAHLKLAK